MTIQQMLLGSGAALPPLSVVANDAFNEVIVESPAPPTATVAASSTATASGGTGSYTYSWTYVSGDTGIIVLGSSTSSTCQWDASVPVNTSRSAVWRITVSDGVSTATDDISVGLTYLEGVL